MNRPIPIPDALKPFKPYGAAIAAIKSADDAMFYAALGSIAKGTTAEQKASFQVYVWKESKEGVLTLLPLAEPVPNNAPEFVVEDGNLLVVAVLTEGDTSISVERDVEGFVDSLELALNRATVALRGYRAVRDGIIKLAESLPKL